MSKQTAKGTAFESQVVNYMRDYLHMPIERRAKCGTNDKGDISGVVLDGREVVLECKNHKRMDLSGWIGEAERERVNAGAWLGIVIHKRRGCGKKNMGDTYVTMTLETLCDLLMEAK